MYKSRYYNLCAEEVKSYDEKILKRIQNKVKIREKQEKEKKLLQTEEPPLNIPRNKWLVNRTLPTYLAETLMTEFSFEYELLWVIDAMKTAVKAVSCSLRKQGFGQVLLLGAGEDDDWYGGLNDGLSFSRFFINVLSKTGAVSTIAYRGCPKIKRIRGHEHAPFLVMLNIPSYTTIDQASYGCSWIIYRQTETLSLLLLDKDVMMEGRHALAAGYAVIGVSTFFVLSLAKKDEVMEFVYDVKTGDFVGLGPLSLKKNSKSIIYNESHLQFYDDYLQQWITKYKNDYKSQNKHDYHPLYIGNIILDAHRIFHNGGVYLSPRDNDCKDGRLRLIFDCQPLAFLIQKLGGTASDGKERILKRKPLRLGEKTPFFFGSLENIMGILDVVKKDMGSDNDF